MSLFDDYLIYEFCIPGGVLGETEIDCPHCEMKLTLSVDEPFGIETYKCSECDGLFEVDWVKEELKYKRGD